VAGAADDERRQVLEARAQKAADDKVRSDFLQSYFSGKTADWSYTKITQMPGISGDMMEHLVGLKFGCGLNPPGDAEEVDDRNRKHDSHQQQAD